VSGAEAVDAMEIKMALLRCTNSRDAADELGRRYVSARNSASVALEELWALLARAGYTEWPGVAGDQEELEGW